MEFLFKLLFCHLVGDYVLQSAYIAETKGKNIYHLFVHCFLYCLPFYMISCPYIFLIFITHVVIDYLKATKKKISYCWDQVLHYVVLLIVFGIQKFMQ